MQCEMSRYCRVIYLSCISEQRKEGKFEEEKTLKYFQPTCFEKNTRVWGNGILKKLNENQEGKKHFPTKNEKSFCFSQTTI